MVGKESARAEKVTAGGSCGNVLAILAFLGWKSYPVGRLGTDSRAKSLLADLQECRVETKFVKRCGTGATPVIIVRILRTEDGGYRSRFEWRDPSSGDRLPSYRPFPRFMAEAVSDDLPNARVFYFDRAEPGTLLLATVMRSRGALVFFEPSSCKDERLFTACMAVSDVVKYSADRISKPPQNPDSPSPRLEIQTLGSDGLRFRLKNSNRPAGWHRLGAFPIEGLKDATGCGDWCSAGLIDCIGTAGRSAFLRMGEASIMEGLRFGQALAAVNCQYEGARGPMYSLSSSEVIAAASKFLRSPTPDCSRGRA
jgi:fructokinase